MKQLFLSRGYVKDDVTLGMLEILGVDHEPFYTLELPWKNNQSNISSIPSGTYKCLPHKYKGKFVSWHLQNVPGREAILIHVGNTVADIQGCILVGLSHGELNDHRAVLSSAKAIERLKILLGDESFTLTIQ